MKYPVLESKVRNRPLYSKYSVYKSYTKLKTKKLVYRNYKCKILFFTLNYDEMMVNDQIVKVLRKKFNG